MKIAAEEGTELLLVFKALPFIPQMNLKTGGVDHVMNVQRCVYRGVRVVNVQDSVLLDFPVDEGKTLQFHVDPDAVMMYAEAPTLVAPPEKGRIVS